MTRKIQLNEQQQAFVDHREGPAALLAVPGSGKTTTMVCRTAALIRSGVPAKRILTMTFTKAAALDMTHRYAELFGPRPGSSPVPGDDRTTGNLSVFRDDRTPGGLPVFRDGRTPGNLPDHGDVQMHGATFSTIHSFALQLIRYYCVRRNRPMPILLSESGPRSGHAGGAATRLGLLSQIYRDITGSRIGEDVLESLSMGISLAKNTMADPNRAENAADPGIKGFRKIFGAYEQVKKERRLVDFDDMLTVAHRILSMDDGILNDMRDQYEYVQVDEAQDSSLIQHAIIDLLAKPRDNLVMIGDEDQSIYVWRGANPSGLLGFRLRYPGAKLFLMETNYRSCASIVHLADQFIRANRERTDKNLCVPPSTPREKGGDPSSEGVELVRVKSLADEYRQVREILQHNPLQGKKNGTTAILYRNNRSAYGLADMLDRDGMPFHVRDFKETLFSHWVTRDMKAFLALMLDPSDRDAFLTVSGKMNAFLSRELLESLQALPQEGSIWKQIRKAGLLPNFQRIRLEEVEQRFKRLARMKPHDALLGLLDCVSYDKSIEFAARSQGYSPDSLNGMLDTLLVIAANEATIPGFLNRLDTLHVILVNAKNPKLKRGPLILSTVHSAKGLEFDRVLLVDMVEGEFPSPDSDGSASLLEEERRLCYVAITRARSDLRVFIPAAWAREKKKPSRFVREMEEAMRIRPPASGLQKIATILNNP